jgi:hypothetical protein
VAVLYEIYDTKIAVAKNIIATKDGTNKNKIPKPIEMIVDRIAIKVSVARFCSFLICNLSSVFNQFTTFILLYQNRLKKQILRYISPEVTDNNNTICNLRRNMYESYRNSKKNR